MLRTGYGEETEIHLKQSCTCMSTNQDMFTCACVVNGYTHTDTLFAYFQSFVLTSYQTKTRPLLCRFVLEGNTSVSKSSPTDGVKRWFTLTPCAPKQPWTRPLSQHKHINYTNHVRYMFFMRKCQFIIQFLRVLIKQVWSYLRIHWLVFENDLDPG